MIAGSTLDLLIFHQAAIKVDERGTETQAITVLYGTPTATGTPSSEEPRHVEIVFDRPFLFFLRHSKTGAILLTGQVQEPETWSE